jgi:N-acetylneuraminate lyase
VIAAAAPGLPFYFYDIPSWTGVQLSMPQFLQWGRERIPTLAGIKYTNSDLAQFQQCLRFDDGAFDILFGTDEALLAGLTLGAQGAIGSTYNFAAPIYHRVLQAFAAGDAEAARREQACAVALVAAIARYGYLAASKRVMAMLGVDVGPVRLPLRALPADQETLLRRDLEALGFFDWINA